MRARRFTEEEDRILTEMWNAGAPRNAIGRRLGRRPATIGARAKILKLPQRDERNLGPAETTGAPTRVRSRAELRHDHLRRVAQLLHRRSLGFTNPIVLRPAPALFGPPLREVEPETRALIDEALFQRAVVARKAAKKPRKREGAQA